MEYPSCFGYPLRYSPAEGSVCKKDCTHNTACRKEIKSKYPQMNIDDPYDPEILKLRKDCLLPEIEKEEDNV